jgi:transposase-like protein
MATMEKQDPSRVRRSFTEEFKADAVAMVLDDDRKFIDLAQARGSVRHARKLGSVGTDSNVVRVPV